MRDTADRGPEIPPAASGRRSRALVVIPAFNEAATIGRVVAEVRAAVPAADIVVVDDGSRDATAERAAAAGAEVVRLPYNLGIGGAVQTGYKVGLEGGYDVAIRVDGDGQHVASEIPRLLAALTGGAADVVIGSRYLGDSAFRSTPARRMGIRLFSGLLSVILGQRITDPTSGYAAVNRRALGVLARHYAADYPEVEAMVVLHRHGVRIREIGVSMRERSAGRSSIEHWRAFYYVWKVLLSVVMNLARRPEAR